MVAPRAAPETVGEMMRGGEDCACGPSKVKCVEGADEVSTVGGSFASGPGGEESVPESGTEILGGTGGGMSVVPEITPTAAEEDEPEEEECAGELEVSGNDGERSPEPEETPTTEPLRLPTAIPNREPRGVEGSGLRLLAARTAVGGASLNDGSGSGKNRGDELPGVRPGVGGEGGIPRGVVHGEVRPVGNGGLLDPVGDCTMARPYGEKSTLCDRRMLREW